MGGRQGMKQTRKRQIETDILKRLIRELRKIDVGAVTPAMRKPLKEALKTAAMVGGCEERDRTLKFLETFHPHAIGEFIVKRSVLDVLGYKDIINVD